MEYELSFPSNCRGLRQHIVRMAVNTIAPTSLDETIIIASTGRSGSTWIGEMMRELKGYRYLNEPFMHTPLRKRTHVGFAEKAPQEVCEWVGQSLRGEIYDFWRWRFEHENPIERAWEFVANRRVAVKFTRALRMMWWISNAFRVRGTVLLIRHPCAVVSSMLRHGGWDENHMRNRGASVADRVLGRNLPEDVVKRFGPAINRVDSRYEMLAHLWGLDYHMAFFHKQPSLYPWILVPYERIVTREEDELYRIANALGVQVTDGMRERLNVASSSASIDVDTSSKYQQLTKWKSHLSDEETSRILKIAHSYGFDMYKEDPNPEYEMLRELQHPDHAWN